MRMRSILNFVEANKFWNYFLLLESCKLSFQNIQIYEFLIFSKQESLYYDFHYFSHFFFFFLINCSHIQVNLNTCPCPLVPILSEVPFYFWQNMSIWTLVYQFISSKILKPGQDRKVGLEKPWTFHNHSSLA